MDALEVLKADHERVMNLIEVIRESDNRDDKWDAFEELMDELDLHFHVEETVFYPSFATFDELGSFLEESFEEHRDMQDLLDEISETSDREDIDDDLEELFDIIEYHVVKEENELFPRALELLPSEELEKLGQRLLETRKSRLVA